MRVRDQEPVIETQREKQTDGERQKVREGEYAN